MADPSVQLHAWSLLARTSSRVLRELERRLGDEHRTSVREFDVLINLEDAPAGGMRMTALADATVLSSGGLTRLVGRLEERGLVRREQDPGDGRSFRVGLTAAGRRLLGRLRTTHDAVVHEQFGSGLTARDVEALRRILGRAAPGG